MVINQAVNSLEPFSCIESLSLCYQYEKEPEIQAHFVQVLEIMQEQAGVQVFDLGSVLIKPVQRILKYPLLLNELIKVGYCLFPYTMHWLVS